MARRPHQPTAESIARVEKYAGLGLPHEQIALLLDIDAKTLRKHYATHLAKGSAQATADVAGALYRAAMEGNTTAQIFWMKARASWRERQDIAVTLADVQSADDATLARVAGDAP